ncbi:hypothetical protein LTR85_010062 [Meristemomyces frigidus]|nr:hypothetical protein LTR85_010062 [Meristemomyces frigidus]
MEFTWDSRLPPELLQLVARHGTDKEYLDSITTASLDARYTDLIAAHCQPILAHVCASLRDYGSLAATVATLGRLVPFAPYLAPFASQLLVEQAYDFRSLQSQDEGLLYLLGLFRLLRCDHSAFTQFVDLVQVRSLLRSSSRPVVYLAIRILQICLNGADHWFEETIRMYLGEDSPESSISGQWDDKIIDYRFLSLWEEQRHEEVLALHEAASSTVPQALGPNRVIAVESLHPSTVMVSETLLPHTGLSKDARSQAGDGIVATETVSNNLRSIATAMKSTKPLLLTGLAGSGKTLLVRHVAQKLAKLDKMVTLHLNEQSDAKLLIGIYTTGNTPGTFVWRPGVLTTAVQEGRWVLIEDLDRAPNEIIGTLLPLIERRELLLPSQKQTFHAAEGFRIIATVRSTLNHRGEETRPLAHMLGARHWQSAMIAMPPTTEQRQIAEQLFPTLAQLLPQLTAVYERLQANRQRAVLVGQSKTGVLRAINPRDLLKWCSRVTKLLHQRTNFTSSDIDDIFMEAIDCFVGALPDGDARDGMVAAIAEELRIDPQRRDYLVTERDVRYDVDKSQISIGRYSLPHAQHRKNMSANQGSFSTNPHTSRMLERVAAAVVNREPLLLVGETGVGKTTAVQHLANQLGKRLEPFNLSQQSEAGDLLGGFKPVTARSLMVPMKDEFDELFRKSFSTTKNQQFLELLGKQMVKGNWRAVCKLWQQALKMVDQHRPASPSREGEAPSKKRKVESKKTPDLARWDAFAAIATDIERRLAAGTEAFAFSFVEGNIVRAVRNGDWVLLDEINLATPDTLESIADLFDPSAPSLLLTEAGNIERIEAHRDFRVFAAMNPATDVGKKDLPPGIRSRFTELYVESPDKDIKSVQSIVRSYLRNETAAEPAVAHDVSVLYQEILSLAGKNRLVDGAGQRPHFSLRTLTRTLSFAKAIAPQCGMRRALFEGFQMSFLTFLDTESARLVMPLLEQHLLGKRVNIKAELQKALRKPSDGHGYVQGYPSSKHWVRRGREETQEQPHYILTPFIKSNLENLVRAASTRQFPVLIQGPTSSGKTSMIEYLAKRTGHKFVRINNHEYTDLQEYLGTYVSGADGRLEFQEGVLVKALREGHWIVLDELNLAPTDVLEALNRLLDDNRELLIPETQETVRPHEDFMLFATQNPAGLYGGRKTLSRAFRNRFLELHFDDIPINELQEILHKRTQLPESWCKRIVTVYRDLSALRQESRLFEQKSFATLRDLFRWALRPVDRIEQLAENGFMLLAERVRKPEEREALKAIIDKAMSAGGKRVSIDEQALYAADAKEIVAHSKNATSQGVVWTKAMRRLYVLVSRAIMSNEPVLLVGETGCGKTTVCQMLADALGKSLHTVNAHQNTETGDLIGSQRPMRNRVATEASLRDQLLASSLLQDLGTPATRSTDALLDAYDRAVRSLDKSENHVYCSSQPHLDIQTARTRFKALFEWTDGSLVQAMKDGAFFLLDEISLADDSVLERINSVLETQRSLLLAEKGSLDSFVTAAPGFQFFATMNPGGDYGKRELSPALRNRFTEIWVPALSDTEDIVQIVSAKLTDSARRFADAIVAFAQWFKDRYNTSANASISVRDALSWVEFVNAFAGHDVIASIVHGAALVYIDTLGANPAGLMTLAGRNLEEERASCLQELGRLIEGDANATYSARLDVVKDQQRLSIGPFSVPNHSETVSLPNSFTFDAETTRKNAMRVLRAMQLSKPVMLEGSPGVGKTALITAIATATGVPLTRINLSEQTDLLDLFGSDAPVEGAATGTFAWRDAPFLRAMKSGEWVLLDEMNLASQSVLEGLNACLDHRGEVYVPELGHTFSRHPDFRLFAAQNPHHQGGGRKGLPASFVNRFTVVFADAFRPDDLMLICKRTFPQVDDVTLRRAVKFVEELDLEVVQRRRFGANGGPWEFNLRDISRWLALLSSDHGLLAAGNARDFVEFLFCQRFRSAHDRAFVIELFSSVFQDTPPANDHFSSMSPLTLQLGLAILPRDSLKTGPIPAHGYAVSSREHMRALESVMLCIQHRWPVVLTGPAGAGKTALLNHLAAAVGAPLVTISMNADTDSMDLIGGYEQSDPLRQRLQALTELQDRLMGEMKAGILRGASSEASELLADLQQRTGGSLPDTEILRKAAAAIVGAQSSEVKALLATVQQCSTSIDKARFEWTDGLLVEALQQGKWLVLDNANLCSPSVLDRLNSLLEPNGTLIINEHTEQDGAPRIIEPHPDFRVFLVVDPRYGELSRAMRNRAVELYLPAEVASLRAASLQTESAMARLRQTRALRDLDVEGVMRDHLAVQDQSLLSRFGDQLRSGLYGLSDDRLQHYIDRTHTAQAPAAPLEGFYRNAVDRAQASADFASVQTIHPLNNQALVQQDQQNFSQASTLAFMHDIVTELAPLAERLSSLRSNQTVMRHLDRTERSQLANRGSGRAADGILTQVESVVRHTLQWSQQLGPIPLPELAMMKTLLYRVCAYMVRIGQMLGTDFDRSLITAWVSAFQDVVTGTSFQNVPSVGSLLPRIQQAMTVLGGEGTALTGRACALMWQHLKPKTPATVVQLNALLALEELSDRFDRLCWHFDQPLASLVSLRLAFLRSLSAASLAANDVDSLTQKLQTLLPAGEDTRAEELTRKRPHFAALSETLCRQFALISMESPCLYPEEVASLELLATRNTKSSVSSASTGDNSSTLQDDFRLLSCALPQAETSDVSSQMTGVAGLVFEGALSTGQVGLGNLDMLESESQTVGRMISTKAHLLSKDTLGGLDACLERLFSAILSLLVTESKDPQLQQLATELEAGLKGVPDGSAASFGAMDTSATLRSHDGIVDTPWMRAQCQTVITHLRGSSGDERPRSLSAAHAWASFALFCLALYVPETPFDPAMKPRLQRDVHRQCVAGVLGQLQALQIFRAATTGDENSLRARVLREDIAIMGPEPVIKEICRPEVSEMAQLQGEFDSLMRAIEPLQESSSVRQNILPESDLFWSNISQIRARLHEKYRAYNDLTGPVIGLVDCLRLSHELSISSSQEAYRNESMAVVENVTPFVKASLATWLSEASFVAALSDNLDQRTTLYLLSVFAARCAVRPLSQSSLVLRRAVDETFARFYQQWKVKLSDGQRKAAANSSLYRFKGDEDLQDDPSAEELHELFPAPDQNATTGDVAASRQKSDQELAHRVSQLHHMIFAESRLRSLSAWDNLGRFSELASTSQQTHNNDKSYMPAVIRSLDGLTSRLSTSAKPGQVYNIYTDASPSQTKILSGTLEQVRRRFEDLRKAWPEHATPVDVLRSCESIFTIGHAEPLTVFMPHLEKLHATITEWQQIASREFSVSDVLEQVTGLIISWRQLELSSWAGLLNREDASCDKNASSWWYIAYENIIAASRSFEDGARFGDHVQGLLKTLEGFMAGCGLGEYLPRLNMLRDFEAHMAAYPEEGTSLGLARQALSNLVAYHRHFEPGVVERLAKGRAGLEKDIKDVIQVASWKDRNIETLKQSAKSSHKRLLRFVRKYRVLLAQPVAAVMQAGVPQRPLDGPIVGLPWEDFMAVVEAETERASTLQIPTWSSRPDRFTNVSATVALMRVKASDAYNMIDAPERIASFIDELTVAISELQAATPQRLTDENKTQVQHLKTRKRRLLADVLKDVRSMGFRSNLGDDILARQGALHVVLANVPALDCVGDLPGLDAAEHSLHRLLGFMPVVREEVRKHSEDLTPAEVARCLTLLESILQVSIGQRNSLCKNLRSVARMQVTLAQVSAFASCTGPTVDGAIQPDWLLEARVGCLVAVMETCAQLMDAQSRLAAKGYRHAFADLQKHTSELAKLRETIRALPKLPAGISRKSTVLLESQLEQIGANIESSASEATIAHPELEPVLSQVSNWSHYELDGSSSISTNGYATMDPNAWVDELLQILDVVLGAMQGLAKSAPTQSNEPSVKTWLVAQSMELERNLIKLRVEDICSRLDSLLHALPHLTTAPGASLSVIASICGAVLPIANTFFTTCQQLLSKLCVLHVDLNKMGFRLATSFVQLAQQGFCSPPEKPEGQKEKAGEVESGTGLGEGEGGEDISKDIGDDEDLSELAQEAKAGGQTDDIEDEKDAVDMADEEMEGELGDAPEASDEDNGDADETTEAEDGIDEEAGDVDDLGPTTVDEKMWDEGRNDEQEDKEVDDAKGTTDDQNIAAGNQKQRDESEAKTDHQEDEPDPDTEAGADEAEGIEQQAPETMDPHAEEQQKLDLPDDIEMDGQMAPEQDADSDGLSEVAADEQQSAMEDLSEEDHNSRAEEHREPEEEDIDGSAEDAFEDADSAEQAAGEAQEDDADDDDAASDVLMQEDKTVNDERQDDAVFGESGTGADEDEATASRPEAAAAAQQGEDEEGAPEQQGDPEAGSSGQQRGTRTQDANAGAEQGSEEQTRSAYKQIGDVLEDWYKQHHQIESARQHDDPAADRPDDVNMAEASFEHLRDEQAAADTQALGTASAEQSTALDEESGLPVNDEVDTNPPPADDETFHPQSEEHHAMDDQPHMEPSDTLRHENDSNAFVGEPTATDVDADIEMEDELTASEDDDVDNVDQQLSNTHLELSDEADIMSIEGARALWSEHEARTRNLALVLTEHLRLILQPTQATKMRGDFRTGKRLNIKRIIPYIASSYKRDKIWMRRSVPSKRSYQIMLAIDDSKSMAESESRDLAFETLALVAKSMSMLEVGELSVIGFGEDVSVAHNFSTPFTSEAGAEVFQHFTFTQRKTNVRKLLAESIELFRSARLKAAGSASDLWQLQLIISDGVCEDHPSIRQLVRQAHEERIMVVFVVVDAAAQKAQVAGGHKQSILDLQFASFINNELVMKKYLDTFPFKYYLVVRDVQELPGVLAGALRQWFAEVVETGG